MLTPPNYCIQVALSINRATCCFDTSHSRYPAYRVWGSVVYFWRTASTNGDCSRLPLNRWSAGNRERDLAESCRVACRMFMLGKTRSQERGVRSDKQHHESEGESRHARLRAPTSWEKVAIGGNTRSDANKGQTHRSPIIAASRTPL